MSGNAMLTFVIGIGFLINVYVHRDVTIPDRWRRRLTVPFALLLHVEPITRVRPFGNPRPKILLPIETLPD